MDTGLEFEPLATAEREVSDEEWKRTNKKLKECRELLTSLEEVVFGDRGRASPARVFELADIPLRGLLDAVFVIELEHIEFIG